ncbi:uncharacterized protein IUM83_17502 [Phytophthora cinnamomi]|uniref:uncharacterized protein n=1 Tax=Phytophthora cinnamomi TaxID=4785 RepID=UPI00355A6369|nr:secreted protein [Phytophthora cinnamomi]
MMIRSVVATLVVGFVVAPAAVQGYAKYVKLIPNGGNVPDSPNIGHLDPAGQTGLSDFGKAFSKAGNAWTTALCKEDTDGDGYTNGQELGDPCCTWTTTNTAGLITDGVSHPSDATKVPTSATLKAGCTSSSTSTNSTGSTGDSVGDVVGTVAPASSTTGGMPPDDDEDDSSESAVLTAGASVTTMSSVAMAVAMALAAAVAV